MITAFLGTTFTNIRFALVTSNGGGWLLFDCWTNEAVAEGNALMGVLAMFKCALRKFVKGSA